MATKHTRIDRYRAPAAFAATATIAQLTAQLLTPKQCVEVAVPLTYQGEK